MRAIYINLDRRTDRRSEFEAECERMGFTAERMSAVEHSVPAIGCTRSHLEALRHAKNQNWSSVFIFEDDFMFLIPKHDFNAIVASFPEDYDVVMLDYYILAKEPYNDQFNRTLDAQSAGGYVVHSRMYDRLIQTLEEAVTLYEANPHCHWLYINDQYWKRLQPSSRWYSSCVRVGKQRPGYSDLKEQYLNNEY